MNNIAADAVRPAEARELPRASRDVDIEKSGDANFNAHEMGSDGETKSIESEQFQAGVQRVRAITDIWSKKTLITMFIFLYLINFVAFVQNAVDSVLSPFITSEFGTHGLLNVGNVMSTALGGCLPLVLAKFIDIFGRVEGFFTMLILILTGMAMKAACNNVQTYIAGHVLYWSGHIGVLYVTDIMVADITTLKNRMIIFALNATPRIVSALAAPKIGEHFLALNWRWGFGAFIIIFSCCCIPALTLLMVMYRKAKKAGLITKEKSPRDFDPTGLSGPQLARRYVIRFCQSVGYYFIQFDIVGIVLLMFAFCLFVLPFTLRTYAPNGWKTPYIIAMIVVGVLLFPIFVFYEAKVAPVQFMPWKYLKDRTIIGSCLLYGIMFLSVFCWNGYFYSYLLVVHRQTPANAQYILNAFSITSSFFGPLIAWWISYSGNFKWTGYTGVPILLLGTALLIPLRAPTTSAGLLAMTQIFVGLGSGIFSICAQLAIWVPVTHQEVAAVNAVYGLFGSFGSSIGYAIAGALWNNILPGALYDRLPEESKPDYRTIFGDIVLQSSFPDGSPERAAIVGAYGEVQRKMVITGSCFIPFCLASIFLWRNINVRKLEEEKGKQTKGTVF